MIWKAVKLFFAVLALYAAVIAALLGLTAIVAKAATIPTRDQLREDAAVSRVLDGATTCHANWIAYLAGQNVTVDPGLTVVGMETVTGGVVQYDFPGSTCKSVLRSWAHTDASVADALYGLTVVTDQSNNRTHELRTFRRLRRAFNVRPSVTISDASYGL